jgi:hypothetical protein
MGFQLAEGSQPDQPGFVMDDLVDLSATQTQVPRPTSVLNLHSYSDLESILSCGSHSSTLITPGTMDLINSLWIPATDGQGGAEPYPPLEQLDYFGNTTFTTCVKPQAMESTQAEPADGSGQDQPTLDSIVVPSTPRPQKKRRQRKKRVRSEEEIRRNRENFLERNRKAAQKCRRRRKAWLEEVQQKKNAASELMNVLGLEVVQLVEEVKTLRALVEAHKDCKHDAEIPNKCGLPAGFPLLRRHSQESLDSGIGRDRRDGDASLTSSLAECLSGNESVSSSIDQQLGEDFSDPCWKVAKEALRRFSDIHPSSLPGLSPNNASAITGHGSISAGRSPPIVEDLAGSWS